MDHTNKQDPLRGKTVRFTFTDGPMSDRVFEHVFEEKGGVTYRAVEAETTHRTKSDTKPARAKKYEVASLGPDLCAVAYLGEGGYTLTTLLDFRTSLLVAFSSNEKDLVLQHGKFELMNDV